MIGNSEDETNFPRKLLLIDKLRIFVKLLRTIYQQILECQKLNDLR